MTKRDFFRIIIKLFGLNSAVITLFSVIPRFIFNMEIFSKSVSIMLMVLGLSLVAVLFFLLIVFKADFIIDKLKLEKGFDEERIEIGNMDNSSLFKFAIILIGGFLIIENVPEFLENLVKTFKSKAANRVLIYDSSPIYWIIFKNAINIVIGFLCITNYKRITAFLDKN